MTRCDDTEESKRFWAFVKSVATKASAWSEEKKCEVYGAIGLGVYEAIAEAYVRRLREEDAE